MHCETVKFNIHENTVKFILLCVFNVKMGIAKIIF